MANDLIPDPSVLDYLPGDPFTEAEVDAAVAALRKAVGWHIAPTRDEMVVLDVNWPARFLSLPTRKLNSVTEVRNADTGEVVTSDRYRVSRKLAAIRQPGHGYDYPYRGWRGCASLWPQGYEAVEVDMNHGYEECPLDLYAVIGEAVNLARRDQSANQLTSGPFNVSFKDGISSSPNPLGTAATLRAYSLPALPVVS